MDVSHFFKGQYQHGSADSAPFTCTSLPAYWRNWMAAKNLNVSRQAVIKTLVRQALNQHCLA